MSGEADVSDLVIELARAIFRRYHVVPVCVKVDVEKHAEGFQFPIDYSVIVGDGGRGQQQATK